MVHYTGKILKKIRVRQTGFVGKDPDNLCTMGWTMGAIS